MGRLRRGLLNGLLVVLSVGVAVGMGEAFVRWLQRPPGDSETLHYATHPLLGWLPEPGRAVVRTHEFTVTYDVNLLGMNDRPVQETLGRSPVRIMALGDSDTFAAGVSQQETWPNVLEGRLFSGDAERETVYNLAVIGFNVGQYLLRMRQHQEGWIHRSS